MVFLKRCAPFGLVVIASAWLASMPTNPGDWTIDAQPAATALAHGHLGDYLSAEAMMGPFATLVQAPFVAVAGEGDLAQYQWASLPCLFAAGLLGLYLAAIARRRGASPLAQALIAALCLVNPLALEALENGHPEELLTAALAVGAVATAAEGKNWRATVLLGLALASKQWAVIAVLPTLMALPAQRIRTCLGALGIAIALTLPALIASPDAFFEVHGNAASTGSTVTPWSIWYPFATVATETFQVGSTQLVADVHKAPPLVGSLSHPLIVLLAFAVPLALAWRRRGSSLSGGDAMALLALIALLRCALDPVDNLYYHAPILLALFGWDAFESKGLPVRGLVGTAAALLLWGWWDYFSDVAAFNATYLAIALTGGSMIAVALFGRLRWTRARRSADLSVHT